MVSNEKTEAAVSGLRGSRYSQGEVRVYIEGYAELREAKDTNPRGLRALVIVSDLDRAISHMPPKEYQAVLLHGLIRLTERAAGEALGVSHPTVRARYEAGIAWITNYLNGETT